MNDKADLNLEILSNHYSETFGLVKEDVKKRDRLFLYLLLLIFVILLYMSAPDSLGEWINSFLGNQVGNDGATNMQDLIDVSFIGTILWFGLLSLAHTYFQTVIHVERQYDYVYKLEKQLCKWYGENAFIREGKHYRENKRKFSRWTKIIYWYFFPFLMIIFTVFWIIFLFRDSNATWVYLIIDSLISLSFLISMGFYLSAVYFKK